MDRRSIDPARAAIERLDGCDPTWSIQSLLADKASYRVLGKPGAGKSTLLRWAAQHLIRQPRAQTLIPLLVPLRSYARWRRQNPEGRIYNYIWREQLRLSASAEPAFLEFMQDIEGGPTRLRNLCRVLLDGWDEVPHDLRADLQEELEGFRWTVPVLATSRPLGVGSAFLPENRFEIVPLPFESMRALIRTWFRLAGRSELEARLCSHLDNHPGLRELARNPYILTLLCAVLARGKSPASRADLYREAFELMASFCHQRFGADGFEFTADTMRRSEKAAYGLLARPVASPFEFTSAEVRRAAADNGVLFRTWEKARFMSLQNEYEDVYAFLHATLQEYLAGRELLRRIQQGGSATGLLGADYRWIQPLTLAAGSVPEDHGLWAALREIAARPDRFGLCFLRIAILLAEFGVDDGGESLIGLDLRPPLWDLFLRAPDPKPYADALVELDADFAIRAAQEQGGKISPERLARVMLLFSKIPPENPNRRSLVELVANTRLSVPAGVTECDTPSLSGFMGFQPVEAHNLASADDVRTVGEIVEALGNAEGTPRQRPLRMRLARTRSAEAEAVLCASLGAATDAADTTDLFQALATLGTLAVRDAVVDWLWSGPKGEDLEGQALRVLQRFPIDQGAEALLGRVAKGNPRRLRVEAAIALGGAQDDRILNRLADYARTDSEPDIEVRRAVLQALAGAGSVAMVRRLVTESPGIRPDPSECLVVSGYLAAIARRTPAALDTARVRPLIETYFVSRLQDAAVTPLEVAHAASVRGSISVCTALRQIVSDDSKRPAVRAAACRSLRELRDPECLEVVDAALLKEMGVPQPSSEVLEEASLTVALLDPKRLLKRDNPAIEAALWKLSLDTQQPLFDDAISNPGPADTPASEHRTQSARPAATLTASGPPAFAAEEPAFRLSLLSGAWVVRFTDTDGTVESGILPLSDGMWYLSVLLFAPRKHHTAHQLEAARRAPDAKRSQAERATASGSGATHNWSDPVMDIKGQSELRQRRRELNQKAAEEGLSVEESAERQFIIKQLNADTKPDGKPGSFVSPDSKLARNVRLAIGRVRDAKNKNIDKTRFAQFLRHLKAIRHSNGVFIYDPMDPVPDWQR